MQRARALAAGLLLGGLASLNSGCAAGTAQHRTAPAERNLEAQLAAERQRSASLQQALEESAREIAKLQTKVARLKAREAKLAATLARREATPPAPGKVPARASAGDTVERLQRELERERARRAAVERELERLRAETTAPLFGPAEADAEALRGELEKEREARRALLAQLTDLQRRAARAAPQQEKHLAGAQAAEAVGLRARLVELETRQQELMASMARTLAADHKREQELLQRLREASRDLRDRTATGASAERGPVESGIAAENARLRALLEEERERNARLAAKLKVASRVTELIFRLRQQGENPEQP